MRIWFIASLVIFVVSCTLKHGNDKNAVSDTLRKKMEIIPISYLDTARVTEENVWLRQAPVEGELITKVNKHSKCYILEKGKADTIHGFVDFWYKVSVGKQEGWIFGSELSVKMATLEDFKNFLAEFVKDYNEKNVGELDNSVHPQYGISYGYVNCRNGTQKIFSDVVSYPDFVSFDSLQHFAVSFPEIDCAEPVNREIPEYKGNLKWSYSGCYWDREDGQVKMVSTSSTYEFYFKAVESQWFLVRIEKIDCED